MSSKPLIQIETSLGEIFLELDRDKAPVSVENFIAYANAATSIGPLYFWRNVSGQSWLDADGGSGPSRAARRASTPCPTTTARSGHTITR